MKKIILITISMFLSANVFAKNSEKRYLIGSTLGISAAEEPTYGISLLCNYRWNRIAFQIDVGKYESKRVTDISNYSFVQNNPYIRTDISSYSMATYYYPVTLQYIIVSTNISPYAGIGISYCKSQNDYFTPQEQGYIPLYNIGVKFLSNNKINVILDTKYFVNSFNKKLNALFLSVGIGYSWG